MSFAETAAQPCPLCRGSGRCAECDGDGLPCDACGGRGTCGSCDATGTIRPTVDTMGEPDRCPWRRARLFGLSLYDAPGVDALDAAWADGSLAPLLRPRVDGRQLPPIDRVPRVGERFFAEGDQLVARAGEPFFSLSYPSAWSEGAASLLDVRVLELDLVRAYPRPHALVVEVRAVHRLADLPDRLRALPEEDPDAPVGDGLLVRDGATWRPLPWERADRGPLTVVRQHGQSMYTWVVFERGPSGVRVLLRWIHVGWYQRGSLGCRLCRDEEHGLG